MTATGRAALALDALFTITDPAERAAAQQTVDALIEQAPPGLVDQAAAAGREVRNRMVEAGARLSEAADVPDWLRLQALEALVGFVAGTARTCRHNPSPRHPRPLAAAAWRPGLVICGGDCRYLLALSGDDDRRCDLLATSSTRRPSRSGHSSTPPGCARAASRPATTQRPGPAGHHPETRAGRPA